MTREGTPKEEAFGKIYMMDSRGLLVKSRDNLTEHKLQFAQVTNSFFFKVLNSNIYIIITLTLYLDPLLITSEFVEDI